MNCSLKCFLEFRDSETVEERAAVIKKYKKGATGPSRGMTVYYGPALQAMKGTLCVEDTFSAILEAIRHKCYIAKWTDKLNDARIEANILAFKAFRAEFANKKLSIFPSPRMHYLVSDALAINLQPELHAEVDGTRMIWKIGMSKACPNEQAISDILQMLYQALKQKGLSIPIDQVRYFDARSGKVYFESSIDLQLGKKLGPIAHALTQAWEKAA